MIRIDADLVRKAKELGLNISKVSENALKNMIARIEHPVDQKQASIPSKNTKKNRVVGLPGFEPGSLAPEAKSLDQASRQPLHSSFISH